MAYPRGVKGIRSLVDEACRINANIKANSIKLDALKEQIRSHARDTGRRGIKGKSGWAVVSDRTSSYIDPWKVWLKLGKNPRSFAAVVKIAQGQLKTYLEDDAVERLKSKEDHLYSVVHLKQTDGEGMERLLRKLDS